MKKQYIGEFFFLEMDKVCIYLWILLNLIFLVTSSKSTLNVNNITDPNSVQIHFMDYKQKQVKKLNQF